MKDLNRHSQFMQMEGTFLGSIFLVILKKSLIFLVSIKLVSSKRPQG